MKRISTEKTNILKKIVCDLLDRGFSIYEIAEAIEKDRTTLIYYRDTHLYHMKIYRDYASFFYNEIVKIKIDKIEKKICDVIHFNKVLKEKKELLINELYEPKRAIVKTKNRMD